MLKSQVLSGRSN